jgi:hypothetical protein
MFGHQGGSMKHRTYAAFVFGAAVLAACSQGPNSNASTININDDGKFTSDTTIEVTGQVGGTDSVSRIGCAVGGSEQAGTLTAGSQDFSCSVNLQEGINTITVAAYNAQGSAATSQLVVMKVSSATIKGIVTNSPDAGGNPVNGAQVQVRIGKKSLSVSTGPTGEFSVPFKDIGRASNFTLNVAPPFGSFLSSRTYEGIPLDAYSSVLGGANDIQVILSNASGGQLPITPLHYGNFVGTLREGETAYKSTNPLGRRVADEKGRRACLSRTVTAPCLNDPPQPGEDGLIVANGQFTAVTDKNGKYLIPRRTIFNTYGTSIAMWAGDYNGTDTGDVKTAFEVFWSKFALKQVANVFLGTDPANPPINTNDFALEAFDPASNARVTSIPVAHDTSGLEGYNFSGEGANALSYSIPKFTPTIGTAAFELGQYVDFTAGPRNLRVFKIPDGAQAQNIEITSQAINLATGSNSTVTTWHDGTNLTQNVNAKFLGIPSIQSPAIGEVNVSTTPTLSWKAVPGARLYGLDVIDAQSGLIVWSALTGRTSISLPYSLAPNTQYVWGVATDDQYSIGEIFGASPTALAASRWVDTNHVFKLRGKGHGNDAMNTWRGRQAAGYLERNGSLPSVGIGTDLRPGQRLISRGFRSSSSESASFTTGK